MSPSSGNTNPVHKDEAVVVVVVVVDRVAGDAIEYAWCNT
eukprot:CAMPEP_0178514376 /NCGR_PEP_ID=MMETSP0696-20121128/23983_1 /TAXON_ID=265572 /ORGANISM="Extubocellulus spinifer, Strain CCMP396" /LENGTH=39 /DNA_ID= /DNA_START= /DNA_END= /DNA_ORIENTATION=